MKKIKKYPCGLATSVDVQTCEWINKRADTFGRTLSQELRCLIAAFKRVEDQRELRGRKDETLEAYTANGEIFKQLTAAE